MVPQNNRWLSVGTWGDIGTPTVPVIPYITEQFVTYFTEPHMIQSPCRPVITISESLVLFLDPAEGSVDINLQVSKDGIDWHDAILGEPAPVVINLFRYKVTINALSPVGIPLIDSITSNVLLTSYEQEQDASIRVDTAITSITWSKATVYVPPVPDRTLDYLGKGLKFPFTFQRRSGGAQVSTATSSDHAHIHESIRQIFGTRKGERFMCPEFGTRLHELVFEQNDRLLYGLIRHEVIEALDTWEPRVIVLDAVVGPCDSDDHLVLVDIRYRLISSQVQGNLVYPFYRELE
ncbi:MAG: GPW/gp25 family protein [Armatimonadota bacterium]